MTQSNVLPFISKTPTTPEFDIELSKEQAPWHKNNAFSAAEQKNIKSHKRIVISIDKIIMHIGDQMRITDINADHLTETTESFKTYGWKHWEDPIIVTPEKGSDDIYRLYAGFHRMQSAQNNNWSEIIVDVVEFDDPLSAAVGKVNENMGSHKKLAKNQDILLVLNDCVDKGIHQREIADAKIFLSRVDDLTDMRKINIINAFMNDEKAIGLKSYNTKSKGIKNPHVYTKTEIGLPTGGNNLVKIGNKEYSGWVGVDSQIRIPLIAAQKQLKRHLEDVKCNNKDLDSWTPWLYTGYLGQPKEAEYDLNGVIVKRYSVDKQKKDWLRQFYKNHDDVRDSYLIFAEVMAKSTGLIDFTFELIKFTGFLPCDTRPDAKNDGRPKEEEGVVYNCSGDKMTAAQAILYDFREDLK